MNKYNPSSPWAFEVYGNFSKVFASFAINESETHHSAGEKARKFCHKLNKEGKKAWVRLKNQ
jgi:hypothetical protein